MATHKNTAWITNRFDNPLRLMEEGVLTDLQVRTHDQRMFNVHKLVLITHSDYFLRMLTSSGMRECKEGVVTLESVDGATFRHILDYIYKGNLEGVDDLECIADIYMAADMFQMTDLLEEVLERLVDKCSSDNGNLTLKIHFLANKFPDTSTESRSAIKEIRSMFEQAVTEKWESLLQDMLALEFEDFEEVLDTKSKFEEICPDFSFSSTQSLIADSVVRWVKHDFQSRQCHIEDLRSRFCLHQLKGNIKQTSVALVQEACRQSDGPQVSNMGDMFRSSVDHGDMCKGSLCPKKGLSGLVAIHAWTPSKMNHITADHVAYSFFCTDSNPYFDHGVPYVLREFGEIGIGEKHIIMPNSTLPVLRDRNFMIMTVDDDVSYSGMVFDGINRSNECPNHHSVIYRFCPTGILECQCGPATSHMSICSNPDIGNIYLVTSCDRKSSTDLQEEKMFDPKCETFKQVNIPGGISNNMSFFYKGFVITFGGFKLMEGTQHHFVTCSVDLNESTPIKAGHSIVTTNLGCLSSPPEPSLAIRRYNIETKQCLETNDTKAHFGAECADAATCLIDDSHLLIIGGFTVAKDEERNLFLQHPSKKTWIWDLENHTWTRGPDLPIGVTRATAHKSSETVILSGGAVLRKNKTDHNQIYQYFSNTKVFELTLGGQLGLWSGHWKEIVDLKKFEENCIDYTVYAVIPTEVTLPSFRVSRGTFSRQDFSSDVFPKFSVSGFRPRTGHYSRRFQPSS